MSRAATAQDRKLADRERCGWEMRESIKEVLHRIMTRWVICVIYIKSIKWRANQIKYYY